MDAIKTPHHSRTDTPAGEATNRLAESSHHFLRHVRCRADEDAVLLEGIVPSFYLKQTAQALVQSVDGVERIINRLVVVNPYGVSSEAPEPAAAT